MPAPATIAEFVELGCRAGLLEATRADAYCRQLGQGQAPANPQQLAEGMVRAGLLTNFQAQQLLLGKWHGFTLSQKYRLLECIGSGGMGLVYLCQHLRMHRLVAVKVLPAAQAKDPANLDRFYREARAVAALNHPNIVRAHDIDQDNNLHYLVLEYVEGDSLQHVIKKNGPVDPARAANYIAQAAAGLQHAHKSGLVHRDIKPANLLLDREGTIKILDLGLARFFHDANDQLTAKHDAGSVLGTADYLAPEQALDSAVDIRADIYSLGATFYFLLAGHAPFHDKSVPQKLAAHQLRQPKPIQSLRKDVPEGMIAVLNRMMAKKPEERFQQPQEIVQALAPWTGVAESSPREAEMTATFTRRESAYVSEMDANPRIPATPNPDVSEIPTAITPRQESEVPSGGNIDSSAVIQGAAPGSAPTGSVLSAMSDTDPFALAKLNDTLISDDSVFCSQFTRGGSSRRTGSGIRRRSWLMPVLVVLLLAGAGVGGWFVYAHLHGPNEPGPNTGSTVVDSVKPGPLVEKSEYVPGGAPFGQILRTITGNSAPITGVALSLDGKTLLVATNDRTPKVWNAQTGKFKEFLTGHAQPVSCVSIAPDGETALTGSADHSLYLWDLKFSNDHVQLKGLKDPVNCVAYVAGGKQAVSGGDDKLLHLWDLKTAKIVRPFQGHSGPVLSVAVASDGRRMLSGSADGTARLWDLAGGKSLQEWKGHQGTVRAVAFSPEGRLAATGGQDKLIFLWDADQNRKVQTLRGHSGTITALQFSPDGRYLLSASADGTARVWEIITGQELFRFGDATQPITCLALAGNGATLALGGPDQEVQLFNTPPYLHATVAAQRHVFPDSKNHVEAVAVSPDGKLAASAGDDRVIRLWDLGSLKPIRQFSGHQDTILSVTFSADGKRLLSSSRDRTIRVWDVAKGNQLELYQDVASVPQALFAPGGQRILGVSADGVLRLWDLDKGKPRVVQEYAAHSKPLFAPPILAVSQTGLRVSLLGQGSLVAMATYLAAKTPAWGAAWSPQGNRFASIGADKTLRLWDAKDGREIEAIDLSYEPRRILYAPDGNLFTAGDKLIQVWQFKPNSAPLPQTLAGHTDQVTALTVSPNGRFALSGARNGEMILWDVAKLRPVHFFSGHQGPVMGLAFTADLRQALSGAEDSTLRLWDLPPFAADTVAGPLLDFGPHPGAVQHLSLSPNGKVVATSCRDHLVRLWDVATGKEIGSLPGHARPVPDVQFSPDGKWLASASEDGTVRLWKVDGRKLVQTLTGHQGPTHTATFSPDGKWLVTGGNDKMAVLWDLQLSNGKVRSFARHTDTVTGTAFVPGGQFIVTASLDKTLRLWSLADARTVHLLQGHTGAVLAVAVAPGGKFAVSGSADNAVCLWDLDNGKLLHKFTGHTQPITSVAWSPDGLRVLSGSQDQTVRLWDVPRRQAVQTLTGTSGSVTSVAFTPDGLNAISCGADRVLRLWTLPVSYPYQFPWK